MTLAEKIKAPGSKKILALDGGGIRGIMTVEILAGIEAILRKSLDNQALVLADYFDFIAGTSTGAIIATCLSLGMSSSEVSDFYEKSGEAMFDKASLLKRFRYSYEDKKLAAKLREVINGGSDKPDITLGTDRLKTLLLMVMRNASTDSPWPISNNPGAKYNQLERREQSTGDCNLDIPLWQLVRASTAAPVYFPPEVVKVGGKEFVFVDGGITTYNNPAFQAFLMATVKPYNLNWSTGEDQFLVVSVGTGTSPDANADLDSSDMNLLYNAGSIPSALMFAALNEQDFLCRVFGKCLAGDKLDNEVATMIGAEGAGPINPKLFTYLRYNAELTVKGLTDLGLPEINPKDVQKLDSVKHMKKLQLIGQKVVEKKMHLEHFAAFTD
ncbi:MAG: putative acylesterase/phospholipase RssA [Desulforhopalus sp.]|jgi:predicted acylesterase/phospholipase RssA